MIYNMYKLIFLGEGNVIKNEKNKGGDELISELKGNDEKEKLFI